jgi:hypothetical protein
MLASLPQPAKRPASASSEANTQTALILFISCSFWGTLPVSPRIVVVHGMEKTAVSSRKFIQKFV